MWPLKWGELRRLWRVSGRKRGGVEKALEGLREEKRGRVML